jgi:hypothetical protein
MQEKRGKKKEERKKMQEKSMNICKKLVKFI